MCAVFQGLWDSHLSWTLDYGRQAEKPLVGIYRATPRQTVSSLAYRFGTRRGLNFIPLIFRCYPFAVTFRDQFYFIVN